MCFDCAPSLILKLWSRTYSWNKVHLHFLVLYQIKSVFKIYFFIFFTVFIRVNVTCISLWHYSQPVWLVVQKTILKVNFLLQLSQMFEFFDIHFSHFLSQNPMWRLYFFRFLFSHSILKFSTLILLKARWKWFLLVQLWLQSWIYNLNLEWQWLSTHLTTLNLNYLFTVQFWEIVGTCSFIVVAKVFKRSNNQLNYFWTWKVFFKVW